MNFTESESRNATDFPPTRGKWVARTVEAPLLHYLIMLLNLSAFNFKPLKPLPLQKAQRNKKFEEQLHFPTKILESFLPFPLSPDFPATPITSATASLCIYDSASLAHGS
ncbi:unnamed protein product [Citrullus colocynthis]|uniref:Uncharacterized protein n=1 Tax=Citrullus colocynthis TaxID=252529 RepID=A0ABP0YG89_9ROSI